MLKKSRNHCKTHLDLGFTDLASNVTNGYLEHHLPAEMRGKQAGYCSGGE